MACFVVYDAVAAGWVISAVQAFDESFDVPLEQLDAVTRWCEARGLAVERHNYFGSVGVVSRTQSPTLAMEAKLTWETER
jgi:hypothetical protein